MKSLLFLDQVSDFFIQIVFWSSDWVELDFLCFPIKIALNILHTGWVKNSAKCLTNSHSFNFQNFICFWLSTPKSRFSHKVSNKPCQNLICLCLSTFQLRFWYIDITFSFTISPDIKAWIRNYNLKIFEKGQKQGINFRANHRNISTRHRCVF